MENTDVAGLFAIVSLFIGLPWIILHHVTKWKTAATLTNDDEALLEELYQLARRLAERMDTVERLVAADHPEFRPGMPLGDRTIGGLGEEEAPRGVQRPAGFAPAETLRYGASPRTERTLP